MNILCWFIRLKYGSVCDNITKSVTDNNSESDINIIEDKYEKILERYDTHVKNKQREKDAQFMLDAKKKRNIIAKKYNISHK